MGRRLHLQATRTKHIDFLMNIGASDFVLDTFRNGCVISFVNPPVSMQVCIRQLEICRSSWFGRVHEVPFIPYVVNPISVATNKSGKKRLILDPSVLNKFAKKNIQI